MRVTGCHDAVLRVLLRVLHAFFFFQAAEKLQELFVAGTRHLLADGVHALQTFQVHVNIAPRQFLVVVLCLGIGRLLEGFFVQTLLQRRQVDGLVFLRALEDAGIRRESECEFPLIVRKGVNDLGKTVRFYLNYSGQEQTNVFVCADGTELLTGMEKTKGEVLTVPAWGLRIVEE